MFALSLLVATWAAIREHEVVKLPGWAGALPSKQYSGYIHASHGRQYHYWFVESERDPVNDPLVLWVQGGPGASSMLGLFTEMGPLLLNEHSLNPDGSVPSLYRNPYSWTREANLIFWESPAGVGYSKCEGICPHYNDTVASEDNLQFLLHWFEAYPEFRSNRFFLTGESYAGVYIPTLVERIRATSKINLIGFAIGNGCMGTDVSVCGPARMQNTLETLFSHSLFSPELYADLAAHCADSQGLNTPSVQCVERVMAMSAQVGAYDNFNIYDSCGPPTNTFLAQACGAGKLWACSQLPANHSLLTRTAGYVYDGPFNSRAHAAQFLGVSDPNFECGGKEAMEVYLNHREVKAAIHVDVSRAWPGPAINYTRTEQDLVKKYPAFVKQYRVLIFSGDFDSQVPYIGTEQWTSGLGLPVQSAWRPWLDADGAVGGGHVQYQVQEPGQFQFLTIRAAGHMVPTDQPKRSFHWFSKWIQDKPFF